MFIKTIEIQAGDDGVFFKLPVLPICETLVVMAHKGNGADIDISSDSDDVESYHTMEAKDSVTLYESGGTDDWNVFIKWTAWDKITLLWS